MARSTYFDLGRSADACLASESGYAQRFQCGNIVKRLIWTRMILPTLAPRPISSEVRGQRRFLCPERFPELMAISLLVCFAAQGK
jgi:hypothetical protein